MPTATDTKTTFRIIKVQHLERTTAYELPISKEQVVKHYKLTGKGAEDWTERVEEYINDNWSWLETAPGTESFDEEDNETDDFELVDFEEL